ncbi:MAG: hypothetical protein KAT77_00990 [Nanoarchaeota archaeon]|nr:hypothetical protein [Nanoarchaeota archaeon]
MKYIILFTILAILGIFFLQEGITGLVVGRPCSGEACDSTLIEKPSWISYLFIIIGAKLIFFVSFIIYKRVKNYPSPPLQNS